MSLQKILANDSISPARRRLLLGGLGLSAGAFGLHLNHIAAAAPNADYKALVCLFLWGGNDSPNTVIPYGTAEHAQYVNARQGMTRARDELLPIATPSLTDGRALALPKEMAALKTLYDQGKVAIVANVGTLAYPVTRAQYEANAVEVPPQLFSHSDQANFWQLGIPSYSASTGWAGRMADLMTASNTSGKVSASVSVAGNNLWQVGAKTIQYPIDPGSGAAEIEGIDSAVYGKALKAMLSQQRSHLIEQETVAIYNRSIASAASATNALKAVAAVDNDFSRVAPPSVPGPMRWAHDEIMGKLSMVARMIAASGDLGLKRQTFFIGIGGFDMHNSLADHKYLLQSVSDGLAAFYASMAKMGVGNKVTTFTASDFGRPLLTNNGGSDHGWGGHHFVVGDAVKGGNLYGKFPGMDRNGPDALSNQGHTIPSTSVDEYAGALARWMGVSATDLPLVLPNIGRFSNNLGFML
jgi:uncharacterized protein (DUF1501 family)